MECPVERFPFRLAAMALCLLGLLLGAPRAARGQAPPAPGTTLRVVLDDDYPPYIFRAPDGSLKGILVDQWALWEKRTGLHAQLDAMAWGEARRRMAAGGYDVIDTMFETEQRRALYDFGPPYARLDVPIFFSRELSGISGPGDLTGFIVGVKEGDNSIDVLRASGVGHFATYRNYEDLVAAARDGRIKVFSVDRPPALYYLIRMGIQDQFRESPPLYSGEFHRAVRKGRGALLATVQQGFDAISRDEYEAIDRRWKGAPLMSRQDLRRTGLAAGAILVVLGLLLAWVWSLRRMVARRTAELRAISRNFSNGMFYRIRIRADGSRRFTFLSDSVPRLYGVAVAEAMADPDLIYRRIHPDDRGALAAAEDEAIRTLTPFRAEVRMLEPDGTVRWSSFVSNPTPLPDGSTIWDGVEFIITDRKKSEEQQRLLQAQLLQAQKLDSLGSLAGGVAHDMNNVLGAVLAIASYHLEVQPPGGAVYRAFDTIAKAATRGGEMVRNLLNFARQTPARTQRVDLNGLVRDVIQLLERTTLAKVRLEAGLEEGLAPVLGDPGALANAIMNLAVNGVDAMDGGGTLRLRTRSLADGWVEILVEDTGAGMTADILHKALDPYFTTKETGKGTGLGLAMVYGTVKAHGGLLDIQSEPGRGTRVSLRFPGAGPDSLEDPEPPAGGPALARPGRSLAVLLVDDDPDVNASLCDLMHLLGHRPESVASGEDALARLDRGSEPDVVFLDLNMPGLGGRGTLPRLRERRPDTPVVLVTGKADPSALDLTRTYRRVTLLPKPFTLAELRGHLDRV
jgi:signal transduction histidine kinase